MRKYLLLFVVVFLLLASCASKKAVVDGVRDGLSFERAIVINETHERPGINDEYAWIRANYPGSRNNSQALVYHDKKPYDILHITTAGGKEVSVYFDISKFFGKF